MRTEKLI